MQVPWVHQALDRAAIASISGYQRHLSPHKGFSCAYRVLHGGESCSQYVKRMIAERGWHGAIAAARERFDACSAANSQLKARPLCSQATHGTNRPHPCQRRAQDCADLSCDGVECCDAFDGCLEIEGCAFDGCESPDCGDCGDCSGCDVGSVDCCSFG